MRWNGDTDAPGNCRAFTYDAAGNLTDVYDGQTSSAFNSLTSATNIAAGNLAYGYDSVGTGPPTTPPRTATTAPTS